MNKWFANNFLDLTLMVSENQLNWMRLDKYALLLGLPTENPFVETIDQQHNFLGIKNGDELLGGALEDSNHSSNYAQRHNNPPKRQEKPIERIDRFEKPVKQKSQIVPEPKQQLKKPNDRNLVLKDALGIQKTEQSAAPNHVGSLLGGYTTGGQSLLNLLNSNLSVSELEQTLKKEPQLSDTQDVLDMLTNMGINAREKPISPPASSPSINSNLSSPDYKMRKASIEVNVSSPRKWTQLPDTQLENLQDIELEQQLESPVPPVREKDWKGWAKINQPQTARLSDIEAEQIKYVKPQQSSGWASVVGQSSQGRKVVVQQQQQQQPQYKQQHVQQKANIQPAFNPQQIVKKQQQQSFQAPIEQQSKRSADFVKWCKLECKRFGVPDPATNVITELAEKQLVVDSLLAMGVDPVDAEHFGEDFIRRVGLDEEMVVVKRRKRRN